VPFEEPLRGWDGEFLAARYDEPSGAWMLVGVHSTVLGPAMGGTRLKVYATPDDAGRDVLRLSQAMTMKQAAADLPYGGGKGVLAVPEVPAPRSSERRDLLLRYADLVQGLGGTYVTAADMNTGEDDMDVIGERTGHVLGRSRTHGGAGDPAVGTAQGVFHAIRATCREAFGADDVAGRTVLIQGCGAVGDRLATHLAEAGAGLVLADVDPARAVATAERTGGSTIPADAVIGTGCDVFAPCATGGVLSERTIGALACGAVAGAANNQLATPEDGDRIRDAGIVYAPDYVANAGGVIWLAGFETLGWDDDAMHRRLAGIADTLATVFDTARSEGISTAAAADRLALARLAAPR
jgi:leucine dehydrogenase